MIIGMVLHCAFPNAVETTAMRNRDACMMVSNVGNVAPSSSLCLLTSILPLTLQYMAENGSDWKCNNIACTKASALGIEIRQEAL